MNTVAIATMIEHPTDAKRIADVMLAHGWYVSIPDAARIWQARSNCWDANWLIIDGLSDDELWSELEEFAEEYNIWAKCTL